jgi:RecA/RadA recombinase
MDEVNTEKLDEAKSVIENLEPQTTSKRGRKKKIKVVDDKVIEEKNEAFFDIPNMTDEEANQLVSSFIDLIYTALLKVEKLSEAERDGIKPYSKYILQKYANKFLSKYANEIGIAIVLAPGLIMRLKQKKQVDKKSEEEKVNNSNA